MNGFEQISRPDSTDEISAWLLVAPHVRNAGVDPVIRPAKRSIVQARSSRLMAVISQLATEALATLDNASDMPDAGPRVNGAVAQGLLIAFDVVLGNNEG